MPILRDVSLEARAGEVIAIVGSSGAGKTTLVNLLPRFYPVTSGALRVDGVDVREVTLRSLREQMAIVTQETILFNDTVWNNICYGQPGLPQERVEAAAKAALAHDFILELPQGYQTMLGDRGQRLSGGQRQRIAIARAILKDSPILILDEATSELDSESEMLVQRALSNLMMGRTAFVIAHRLSTIRRADKIIVLEDGTIAEAGTHQELLARGGTYARLYEMQFADADDVGDAPAPKARRMKAAAAATGIHSMTGFAQARVERDGCALRINLRSVNHRFLDLHLRMPDGFEVFESRIRQAIRNRLRRGHVDVNVYYEPAGPAAVEVNREVAEAYMKAVERLRREFDVKTEPDLIALFRLAGRGGRSGSGQRVAKRGSAGEAGRAGGCLPGTGAEAAGNHAPVRRAGAGHGDAGNSGADFVEDGGDRDAGRTRASGLCAAPRREARRTC